MSWPRCSPSSASNGRRTWLDWVRVSHSGAQLAEAEKGRDRWQADAEELERLCMQNGSPMPTAPDEGA